MSSVSFLRRALALSIALTAISASAQLIQWNTFGNLGTETTEASTYNDANISSSSLNLGPGLSGSANTDRFGGNNWFDTGNTASGNTLAEAIAGNNYISFTVTPNSGFQVSLTSLVFSWQRSSTGPTSLAIRTSLDNYASTIGLTTISGTSLTTGNSITLTSLSSFTSSVTLRLYGYGATGTSGSGGFDTTTNVVNVQLNGAVSAIPEPSTYAALAGACALGGVMWHRRRQRVLALKN